MTPEEIRTYARNVADEVASPTHSLGEPGVRDLVFGLSELIISVGNVGAEICERLDREDERIEVVQPPGMMSLPLLGPERGRSDPCPYCQRSDAAEDALDQVARAADVDRTGHAYEIAERIQEALVTARATIHALLDARKLPATNDAPALSMRDAPAKPETRDALMRAAQRASEQLPTAPNLRVDERPAPAERCGWCGFALGEGRCTNPSCTPPF